MILAPTTLPNQYIPKGDWTDEKYIECLTAIAQSQSQSYMGMDGNASYYGNVFRNIMAYKGMQVPDKLKTLVQAVPGMGDMGQSAIYIPGYQTKTIVNYHQGRYLQAIKTIPKSLSVRNMNPDVRNEYTDYLNVALYFYRNQEKAAQLQQLGMTFKQMPPFQQMNDEREVASWVDSTFMDETENGSRAIALSALARNKYLHTIGRMALNMSITATAVMWQEEDETSFIPRWRPIDTLNAGLDRRQDDDLGLLMEYGVEIDFMPIAAAESLFKLTKEERQKIESTLGNFGNSDMTFGFRPYFRQANGQNMVSVIRGRWQSVKDSRTKTGKDGYGNFALRQLANDDKRKASNWLPCTREGVLIGGSIVKQHGERKNHEYNSWTGMPTLGITAITPNMTLGSGESMVQELRPWQEFRDNIWVKVQQAMRRDYGKQLKFDSSKYSEGQNKMSILRGMINEGIIEWNGEDGNGQLAGDPVNVVDMGVSPVISMYMGILDRIDMEMSKNTGTSPTALGQQDSVIGKGVQENTVSLNSIQNIPNMTIFMEGVKDLIQSTVDQARMNLYAEGGGKEVVELTHGQSAVIHLSKGQCMYKLNVYLNVDEVPQFSREQASGLLIQTLTNMSMKGTFPDEGMVAISGMIARGSSLEELKDMAEMYARQAQEQKNRQMAAEAAMQQSAQQNSMNTTVAQSEINQQTANQVADKRLQETAMKEDAETERATGKIISEHARQ